MSDEEINDYFLWRNLSPDIVAQVLSRLPLKSLCRFKCVSRSWKSLISFHIRQTKSNPPQNAILISTSHALYSVDFADVNPTAMKLDLPLPELSHKEVKILGSCNGLFLFSHGGHSIFLWNPLTRECKKLPESPFFDLDLSDGFYSLLHGLGYDSSADDYKIVILGCYADTPNVAVYSLKTDAWRRILDFESPVVDPPPGIYFNERFHWLWRSGRVVGPYRIVAFDFSEERFIEVQLPAWFDYKVEHPYDMAVVGGCLCLLVGLKSNHIEVWMMKEYGVRESWTRLRFGNPGMSITNLLCSLSEDDFVLKTDTRPIYFKGRRVRVARDKLVVYNMKKETMRDMVIRGISTKFIFEATYIATLVSPKHIGRIGRQCEASSVEIPKSYQGTLQRGNMRT